MTMALSIFISGILGALRFSKIGKIYRPFIYLVWIGCFNELLNIYLGQHGHYTFVNMAFYDLCESVFLLWFFRELKVLKSRRLFYVFLITFVAVWCMEVSLITHFKNFMRYYFAVYYLCIVLLSIRAVNDLLFTERELGKNPAFLICVGMIVFFTFGIISKMFMFFNLNISTDFLRNVSAIYNILNFLTNLIYALAVLWMRKRQAFTLQF